MLEGKHIILGITGSIAAYKAAVLCRLLVRAGAEVRVLMTPVAKRFITPLTMATLSKNPVFTEFFDPENGAWNSHVSLGEWADCLLIAPATANTMAKMAGGIADNLLLTTYLSARSQTVVAPAMDLDMYAHPATQSAMDVLRSRGVKFIEPAEGELASGLSGKGRMAEPEDIVAFVDELLTEKKKSLTGLRFMVTAGATEEPIDPVRFVTNRSTGKMGCAIADELLARGGQVTIVCGRTNVELPAGAEVVEALSAEQMYRAAAAAFERADAGIMCAAVADYAPAEVADTKIKKHDGEMLLRMRRTPDIAASLGAVKGSRLLVGFALETDSEMDNARGKLERKNLDFIVLNSLRDKGAGFGTDTNKITLLDRSSAESLPLMSKRDAAKAIVDKIEKLITAQGDASTALGR
ncbi:MAG: bifunctional phosphopantothenoylcysteine decarboxylase/phosphopantothenate--cysteine ligase CoaBC [Alistipes sp.]|nr:bifunctional phosphopantothenoylcysteine decarboxylase/phosphopantothenate--cysteine ligase CoaBC [Alistipes sp.]